MDTKKKMEIIYIGDVGRSNTALSIHAQNIAYLFSKIGYHVTFICDGEKEGCKIESKPGVFDYFYTKKYVSIPKISGLEWLLDELTGWKYRKILRQRVNIKKPEFILMYGYAGETWLTRYCHNQKIPFLIERVDWFEKDDRNGFVEKEILQKQVDDSILRKDKYVDGVISISKFFQNYYSKKEVPTIFIPPIFDVDLNKTIDRFENSGKVRLVYAGSVGGSKDQLLPVLQAIKHINERYMYIHMDIVGPTMEEVENATSQSGWCQYGINVYGRVSNDCAKEIIQKADFSLLLRNNKRYAKAGFSTKFAESMCLGVPVICTKVGGADSIITNMKDGILLENNDIETIENTLQCLIEKKSEEILEMKKNAYKKACDFFSINSYIKSTKCFLEKVGKKYEFD